MKKMIEKHNKSKDSKIKNSITKSSKGITLVALVITIIILLILAGISISSLTGSGLLKKANDAVRASDRANVKEQLQLAVMASINNKGDIDEEQLRKELENLKNNVTIDSYEEVTGDSTIIFTATKGKNEYEIDGDGNVELKGATIVVRGLTVKNGETVLTESSEKVAIGEPLKVNFKAEIEGGKITSIKVKGTSITNNNGEVEYTTDGSTSVIFEIEGKTEEGITVTKKYEVNLKGYYDIPEMKVGDYVNYIPDTPTEAELAELNSAINTYSGYSTTQTLSQTSEMKWRILELDETGTKPETLISTDITNELLILSGANGYNNAVYLLNEACKILYSKEGVGESRSLTIEDLETHYSEAGIEARDNYKYNNSNAEGDKYGDIKRYEGSYSKYPKIALVENNMGINTTPLDKNNKNPLKTDGLSRSEQGKNGDGSYMTYEGSNQASENGITVKKTYYNLRSLSNLSIAYDISVPYYNIFHQDISNYCWLASRCVNTDTGYSGCYFNVCFAGSANVSASYLFDSYGRMDSPAYRLRPLVSIKSNIEAEYSGVAEDNTYNIWNI